MPNDPHGRRESILVTGHFLHEVAVLVVLVARIQVERTSRRREHVGGQPGTSNDLGRVIARYLDKPDPRCESQEWQFSRLQNLLQKKIDSAFFAF